MSEDRNSSANSSQQMSRESSNDGLLEVPNRLVISSNNTHLRMKITSTKSE